MAKHLNDENIFSRLKLAFAHNQKNLKTATLAHIANKANKCNFKTLMESEDWAAWVSKNQKLSCEITKAIFEKLNY